MSKDGIGIIKYAALLLLDGCAMWFIHRVFLFLKPPVTAEEILSSGFSPFLTQAPISKALTSGEVFPHIYRYLLLEGILGLFALFLAHRLLSLIFRNNERIFYPQSRR